VSEAGITGSRRRFSAFFGDISALHSAAWQYVRLIPTNVKLWLKVPYAVMCALAPGSILADRADPALVQIASSTAAERHKQLRWS
jgi:hypothetical protein